MTNSHRAGFSSAHAWTPRWHRLMAKERILTKFIKKESHWCQQHALNLTLSSRQVCQGIKSSCWKYKGRAENYQRGLEGTSFVVTDVKQIEDTGEWHQPIWPFKQLKPTLQMSTRHNSRHTDGPASGNLCTAHLKIQGAKIPGMLLVLLWL